MTWIKPVVREIAYDRAMADRLSSLKHWLGTGSLNLFGRPFAGKDTQGRLLAAALGAPLIGGGDILRSHHEPARIQAILDAGGMIPHDVYLEMLIPYLSRDEYAGKPLVLSSVGRSEGEEATIMHACEASGHPLRAVVELTLDEAEVWARFEAAKHLHDRDGRADDNRITLKNRLQEYHDKTLPVLEYYRTHGLLVEVDGRLSREAVLSEIIGALPLHN